MIPGLTSLTYTSRHRHEKQGVHLSFYFWEPAPDREQAWPKSSCGMLKENKPFILIKNFPKTTSLTQSLFGCFNWDPKREKMNVFTTNVNFTLGKVAVQVHSGERT